MKKIINTAPPVVVSTVRTPIEGSLTISSNGGALTQVYDAVQNAYEPVDRQITPLILSPIISIVDPDTQQQVPLSSLSNVVINWYIGNSNTPITSRVQSDDYHLQTKDDTDTGVVTGNLVVRRNIGPSDSFAKEIMCELSFTENSRGESYKFNASVLLTTEEKVQDMLFLQLDNPSKVTFNPIFDDSSQRTFKAKVYNGGTLVSNSNFKFFWYVNGVLANTKACYVSGQNTDTLVLDAEYADNVLVKVCIATDKTANNPNHPASAECTLVWKWPRMKVIPYSLNGESIKLASQSKSFGTIIQAYGHDIPEAKRNRYCKVKWYTQPTNVSTHTNQGWGFTKSVSGSDLFRTGGIKVNVGAELYSVGAKNTVGGSGVETKIASTEQPVVITTQRTPLVGALSISSNGGALTQVYDAVLNTYEPVDRNDTPLVLSPVISVTDPDTGQSVPLTDLSSIEIRWYIGNSMNYVTSRVQSDDYHLQTDDDTATGNTTGSLVVRHNVGPNDSYAVPILCEFSCTDNSRAETYKFTSTILLTTEEKVQKMLSIQLGNPSKVTYNPIEEDSSLKVFTAKVYNGGTLMQNNNFKFFWYINDVMISDENTLGYVSGQGTDTLILDAEYLDNVIVKVRIATITTLNAPNHPANAECTLVWHWPRMQALPYSLAGESVRNSDGNKRFSAFVQAYGKDIPDSKRDRYCRLNFYTQPTTSTTKTSRGWGNFVTVAASNLFRNDGAHTNVGVELYTLGSLKAVSQNGSIVTNEQGKVVVVGY